MSIIKPLSEKPTEAKLAAFQIDAIARDTYNYIDLKHKKSYELFWNNPKATPQEICDEKGTEAKELFDTSLQTQIFLKFLNPLYEIIGIPEGCEVIEHEDGRRDIIDNRKKIEEETPIIEEVVDTIPEVPEENNTPSE